MLTFIPTMTFTTSYPGPDIIGHQFFCTNALFAMNVIILCLKCKFQISPDFSSLLNALSQQEYVETPPPICHGRIRPDCVDRVHCSVHFTLQGARYRGTCLAISPRFLAS